MAFKSAMNGSTSTFSWINMREEISIVTYDARKSAGSAMGAMTGVEGSKYRVSIDERSAIVDTRQRLGDWEVDTIIGKGHRHAIVSLTERKSRLALLRKVERKTAQDVADAVIELMKSLPVRTHTITADNGQEFADHERISKDPNTDVYFAHPYSSWERGTNENMNGLVRQYFPKKCNFTTITETEIEFVMERLNNRPRKCLRFKSPNQVFFNHSSVVALGS